MAIAGLKLTEGLSIHPSTANDQPFLEQLHHSTRTDLQLINGEQEFIDSVIEMQFRAQSSGYGSQFPNAMYFIVEKQQTRIGKVSVDFGPNEVRVIDIAFIPQARNKGFGESVLRALQQASTQVATPLVLTVDSNNLSAKRLYLRLGFVSESIDPPYELMTWYPTEQRLFI
ncbi:GNAT family N-acetyltransferase [Bacterioplanoides pacificum]|uniref:GNAT family N-acetyltransferase n=1 Tax=Bacterioplanoides pacificum TaxID=1171596 RepID=A0ABV7VQ99_9GAMM